MLGVPLIVRNIHECIPTVEGTAFITHAESLLRLNARAIAMFRNKNIAIGASSNIGIYLLHPYIKTYFNKDGKHPAPVIQIHQNPVVLQKLEASEIDIAAMEWWDNRPGFIALPWRQEELVAVVPPGHPWSNMQYVSYRAFRDVPLLGGEPGTGTGRLLTHYFGKDSVCLQAGMQLGSTEAVKQWIKSGLGVSIMLKGTVTEECNAGTLVAIPFAGPPPTKPLYVVWRESLSTDNPARVFGEWLATHSPVVA